MTKWREGRGKYRGDEWRQYGEEAEKKRTARGAKKEGKGETAAVHASVVESRNCLLAQRTHMSLGERGGEVKGGRGEH